MKNLGKILLRKRAALIQLPVQELQIFFRNGEPRRHLVSPEFQEQIPAAVHLFIHVIGLHGAPGSLQNAFLLCPRQNEGRPVIPLPQSPCNDSGKRFMAVLQTNHQHLAAFHTPALSDFFLNHPDCRLHPLFGHALSAVIELL